MVHQQKMLAVAIEFATAAHKDQFDHGGFPYILHPMEVMRIAGSRDEEQNCVCVLHDVIEDAFIRRLVGKDAELELEEAIRQLRRIGMSQRVIDGTVAITKVPWRTEDEYYDFLMLNELAVVAKCADLQHNMTITRLNRPLTEKELDRNTNYVRRYSQLVALRFSKRPMTYAPILEGVQL